MQEGPAPRPPPLTKERARPMENPKPANLLTVTEVRARGWQAEARDKDGHLISLNAPFRTDADIVDFVRENLADGNTITIWPESN